MRRGKTKLELLTDKSVRTQTYKKRTRGFMKKANELATLCGVKVCAVIQSRDSTEPDFWPSREGVEAVFSDFMNLEETKRFHRMYDQESYTWERIIKAEEKRMKVRAENREMELTEIMFNFLKGEKIPQHHYHDANFIREFQQLLDDYHKKLTHRKEILMANGESVPLNADATDASGPVVGDVNQVVVGTEGSVSNPTEVYDHMPQYDDMDMSVNEQAGGSNDHVHNQNMNHHEQFQYQTPSNLNLYDQTQPRFYGSNQGVNMNRQVPFQYQTPTFYDQTQPRFYGSNQGVNMNRQVPFPHQTPTFYDQTQPRFYGSNQGVNMNRQVPFQYQTPTFYDQNQPRFYGSSQDVNTGLTHDQGMNQPTFYGSSQDMNTCLSDDQGMNQPRFYGSSQEMNTCLSDDQGMNQPRFYGSSQDMNTCLSDDQGMNQPRFYGSSQDMNTCLSDDHGMNQPRFYGSSQDMNTGLTHGQGMNQPRFYGSSQDMTTCLSHDQGMNQYPNPNQSFTSLLMGQLQQMSGVQYLPSVASMDDNNNSYHQLPITSQIPSTTTTTTSTNAAPDLSGHSINNKRWPTRLGLD
ncbi:unnamed protein product [Eruca vesicaria subsp. sativa]|uniref:MADS-box domain-containing protein n=1 Tax=Eruca vesicaria subsp. sativa TaxID=29727 RepID=A0ABC8K804_ERUVS|nr:unnamed protein product [Eruca vesicaria subsp. sativa]